MPGLALWVVSASMVTMAAAEEESSQTAIAIGGTLIAAVSFQMVLLYLVNHRDEDMRRYSYEIINTTISIFAAVMCFQMCNDLVEMYIIEPLGDYFNHPDCIVDFGHMLIWYVMLQLSLAWISGAIGEAPKSKAEVKLNMSSFALLLAHCTGFASINAWGSLQQLPFFSSSALMSFSVVPISICGQFVLQRITDKVRYKIAMGDDGKEDEWEKLWDEYAEEAENDVMGLTLSFNLTQATRFAITGMLPNQEGAEELPILLSHPKICPIKLYLAGLVFVILMIVVYRKCPVKEEGEEEEENEASEALEKGEETQEGEQENACQKLRERASEAMIITFSMAYAWCIFFGTRMALAHALVRVSFSPGDNPALDLAMSHNVANNTTTTPTTAASIDPMILAVFLTMVISFASFSCIRLLDIISDRNIGDKKTIGQIIKAISILVGFGWEQCFDQAVEAISSVCPTPQTQIVMKTMLGIFCIVIIVPAWKWYLLPMAVRDGWKFGFVIDETLVDVHGHHSQVHDIVQHLLEKHGKKELRASTKAELGMQELLGSQASEKAERNEQRIDIEVERSWQTKSPGRDGEGINNQIATSWRGGSFSHVAIEPEPSEQTKSPGRADEWINNQVGISCRGGSFSDGEVKAQRSEQTKSRGRGEEGIDNQVAVSTASASYKDREFSWSSAPTADVPRPPPTWTTATTRPSELLRAKAADKTAEAEATTKTNVSLGSSWADGYASTRPYSPPRYFASMAVGSAADRKVASPTPGGAGAPLSSRGGATGQSLGRASSRPRTPRVAQHELLQNLDALEDLTHSLLGALSQGPPHNAHYIGTPRDGSP